MNNYDELKSTTEENAENTVVSVNQPKPQSNKQKRKKHTLLSIFISALKAEGSKAKKGIKETTYSIPVPKYTIFTIVVVIFIGLFLLVMRSFSNLLLLIPLNIFYWVTCVPSILLVFFVEFNTRNNISLLQVILMCLFGVLSFAVIDAFCNEVLIKFLYPTYIKCFATPILLMLLLYFVVFIFSNILKVDKFPECILLAVSFMVGYVLAQSLLTAFDSLFISEKFLIGDQHYILSIITTENLDLTKSLDSMLSSAFIDYVYNPIFIVSLSISVGTIISYKERSKSTKITMPKLMYLLLFVNIIIYVMAVFETNFIYYNLILKVFAMGTSLFLSYKLLNNCLQKESADVS